MEVSAILNDPSIDFPIRHARTPVYRHKTYLSNCSDVEIDEAFSVPKYISEICIKDHLFDLKPSNFNKKLKKLSAWWEPPKWVPGVRKYYKLNEMSFTLSERMGFAEIQ